MVTNIETGETFLGKGSHFDVTSITIENLIAGVVIADDTIVTEAKVNETIMSNIKFGLLKGETPFMGESITVKRSEIFTSTIASSRLEDTATFLLLEEKIPTELFRPICIPPPRYVEKMIKPNNCQGDPLQTITKVRTFYISAPEIPVQFSPG